MRELIARVQALLRRVEVVRQQTLAGAAQGGAGDDEGSLRLRRHLPENAPPENAASENTGQEIDINTDGVELEIDRAARRVRVDGADVHLTPIEFDLLGCLARKPGMVASRESLLAEVWDWADASGTRTVDSHVKALRKKIGAEWIRTVHGIGYALEAQDVMPAAHEPADSS
jgi:DNA-binding response OmpR family regulator